MRRGQVLQEAHQRLQHVHFIERGVASFIVSTPADGPVEVSMVGRFGLVGAPVLLGTMQSPQRCVVQIAGEAQRIPASELRAALRADKDLNRHLLAFVQALLFQHAQTTLCNVRHQLSERVCRWLLLAFDRLDTDAIPVTHEMISALLNVRRAGVTNALAELEHRGAVVRRRGALQVRDRAALARNSCECYSIIVREYERLFATSPARAAHPRPPQHLAATLRS